ncbi:MAG: biosynthetic-type acetolactate synthase large subunit [Actinobacteria bacterium]|nr:biosynthetic-type acetolactate synthase large subunit [Actinomycetota bacterium]
MKLSDYIVDFLLKKNINYIFEVVGGSLAHIIDSLYNNKHIKTISMHHEQAAAFAAEGYSRVCGNFGVALATSGPGATNLITGIGSCYFDSIPCLFITGQVNTYEFKFDKQIRQNGFQETDIVSIVKPIVKYAKLVTEPQKIRYYLEKAIFIAKDGRPGPVLLDIPLDIQRKDININEIESFNYSIKNEKIYTFNDQIDRVVKLIQDSKRPVFLIGGGLRLSGAVKEFNELEDKLNFPVVTTLMGLDAFNHENSNFVGMIGTYGNRYANLAIANTDLIIALGTRFDTRQTGTNPDSFARSAKIIHVDIDPNELSNKIKADVAINCDIKKFLNLIAKKLYKKNIPDIEEWKGRIDTYKIKYPSFTVLKKKKINPNYFMDLLSLFLPRDSIICADVGQTQMWAAQSLKLKANQRFLTQGGMGSMGSALALGIGASFSKKNKKLIIVISGDGGFQLNIQELQTVYHHNLPIKIIILNNSCYGMVRQFQQQYFNSRFQSTIIGYSAPDFMRIAEAYKITSYKINKINEVEESLKKLFSNMQPMLLEIKIDRDFQALPKLSVNKPIEDQEPYLTIEELKANMLIKLMD